MNDETYKQLDAAFNELQHVITARSMRDEDLDDIVKVSEMLSDILNSNC